MSFDIQSIISSMSIEDKISQMFLSGIVAGESEAQIREYMETNHFGGYSLSYNFARFIRGGSYHPCGIGKKVSLEETAEFLHKIKEMSWDIMGVPAICTLDQEGGMEESEFRRSPVVLTPNQMGLAAIGDPDEVYNAAYLSASQLKAIGVDMLLGPCMDVNSNPQNVEIAHRALGDRPEVVAQLGTRVIKAYQDAGIFCTAKHFPGRGHAGGNAHADLDVLKMPRSHYDQVEFVPFRAAIEAGVDMVMLSHTIYPALGDDKLPASMSPVIINEVLKKELGFKGIVYTDDISMLAISKIWGVPTACAMAFEAGCDMILMKVNKELPLAVSETKRFIEEGKITEAQLDKSVERVLKLKEKYGMLERKDFNPASIKKNVATPPQVETGKRLARRSSLILRNDDNVMPLGADKYKSPLVVAQRSCSIAVSNDPNRSHDMLLNSIRRYFPQAWGTVIDQDPTRDQIFEMEGLAKNSDVVIFTLFAVRSGEAAQGQYDRVLEGLNNIMDLGIPVIVIITGAPYLAAELPKAVRGIACSFSAGPDTFEAVVDLMCGKIKPEGTLPVHINEKWTYGFKIDL